MKNIMRERDHKRNVLIPGVKCEDADLLKVPGGVDAGLDFALLVEIQDGVHGLSDELHLPVQVAQVEAAHRLVPLDEAERVDGELVVPVLGHGDQVLLLAREHVSGA